MIMMYSLDEIGLLPSSNPVNISSRQECCPFNEDGNFPIFVAPMTSVLDFSNYEEFKRQNVIPIIPRRLEDLESRKKMCSNVWCAFSLSEFQKTFCDEADKANLPKDTKLYVLIDMANGHMQSLYDTVKLAKSLWNNLVIMIGNIAHPDMYWQAYLVGADYVRVGIGTGSVCTTGVKTGIHASTVWLLEGIKKVKTEIISGAMMINPLPKVIADGGISTIDRAIKCLALGADYVMMGKMFAQCTEACGQTRIKGLDKDPQLAVYFSSLTATERDRILNIGRYAKERLYYGMASKRGQKDISGIEKAEEGIEIWVSIEHTLESLLSQFDSALRSAMSYTGCKTLKEFKNVKYEVMSPSERNAYYK